ncbi:hypothetical protein QUB72_02830 [Enterococcus faecium]|nr:hypothetical protein [Enterococcus faecium]
MKFMEDYLMQMETWTLKEMNNASIILPMLADDIRPLFLSRFKRIIRTTVILKKTGLLNMPIIYLTMP